MENSKVENYWKIKNEIWSISVKIDSTMKQISLNEKQILLIQDANKSLSEELSRSYGKYQALSYKLHDMEASELIKRGL
jgi:hypothetical protein